MFWTFNEIHKVHMYIFTLNSRHFAYVTSRTTCVCTLTVSTLLVEHVISSIWINRITTRSCWKFRTFTTTNDLTLYSFSSLYIFVTWGWPTVAETCRRQHNKTDTKTSLSLHRAFRRITWSAHQPMHTHKTVYTKTFKIAPTCFDHHQGAVMFLAKITLLKTFTDREINQWMFLII